MTSLIARRNFLAALGGTALTWPLAARAQQAVVGFLQSASPQRYENIAEAFRQGLSATGDEGRNVAIEYRWGEDHIDRLPALAADLVNRPVDIMAANSVAALAAKVATATIPIVFQSGVDPVKIGLVASLGHPGGNVTGVSFFASTLEAKKLEVLHEIIPSADVIAALVNSNNPEAETQSQQILAASRALGCKVFVLKVANERDVEAAFATLVQRRVAALVVVGDPYFNSQRQRLIALAARNAIAAIYSNRENVDDGGLVSYGSNLAEAYRQVGIYVGRILGGKKAADLPVLQPTKFELVINLKTAKILGINVPSAVLDRADEIIE
jgi:putative tryptophan/tyrosine transport system substrate-binding protein